LIDICNTQHSTQDAAPPLFLLDARCSILAGIAGIACIGLHSVPSQYPLMPCPALVAVPLLLPALLLLLIFVLTHQW
jgi:hypothetical protein